MSSTKMPVVPIGRRVGKLIVARMVGSRTKTRSDGAVVSAGRAYWCECRTCGWGREVLARYLNGAGGDLRCERCDAALREAVAVEYRRGDPLAEIAGRHGIDVKQVSKIGRAETGLNRRRSRGQDAAGDEEVPIHQDR